MGNYAEEIEDLEDIIRRLTRDTDEWKDSFNALIIAVNSFEKKDNDKVRENIINKVNEDITCHYSKFISNYDNLIDAIEALISFLEESDSDKIKERKHHVR